MDDHGYELFRRTYAQALRRTADIYRAFASPEAAQALERGARAVENEAARRECNG